MNTEKKVTIIGHGYVGQAMERFFNKHFTVKVYDPKYFGKRDERPVVSGESVTILNDPSDIKNQQDASLADLFVICVPTPESDDHSVDMSFVEAALAWLPEDSLVLIKSTIPPGSVDRLKEQFPLRICFSPEYIGEGKYQVQWWKDKNYPHPTDMKFHDFQIVGGDRKDARDILEFFKKVTGPEPKYMVTDAKTAELCKYMENCWGGTKVTFCNEFAEIAEAMGVDYDELRELFLLDGRVERMHTAVFKDARGFGGKCFPKDINGIVEQAKKAGYTPKLLASVLSTNEEIRTRHGQK